MAPGFPLFALTRCGGNDGERVARCFNANAVMNTNGVMLGLVPGILVDGFGGVRVRFPR